MYVGAFAAALGAGAGELGVEPRLELGLEAHHEVGRPVEPPPPLALGVGTHREAPLLVGGAAAGLVVAERSRLAGLGLTLELTQRPPPRRVQQLVLGRRVRRRAVGHRFGLIRRQLPVAYRVLRAGQLPQPPRAGQLLLGVAGGLPGLLREPLRR